MLGTLAKPAEGSEARVRERISGGMCATWVGFCALLNLSVTLPHLGRAPLWRDEAWAATLSRHSLSQTLHIIRVREPNMALYYVLLHGWISIDPSGGEGWIRLLSVVFGVATVPLAGVLGHQLMGRAGAMGLSLAFALNPFLVYYDREARSYSLLVLLGVLATIAFVRALREPTTGRLVLYAALVGATVYAHSFAPVLVLAHLVAVVATQRSRPMLKRWTVAYAGSALLVLPLYVLLFQSEQNVSWIHAPPLRVLLGFTRAALGTTVPALLLLFVVVIGGAFAVRGHDQRRRIVVCGALGFALPLTFVVMASQAHPIYVDRYLIPLEIPLLLLVVAALLAVPRRFIAGTVVMVIAVVVTTVHVDLDRGRAAYKNEDLRAAAAYVEAHARPGDAIVYAPSWARVGFAYYGGTGHVGAAVDAALAPGGDEAHRSDVLSKEVTAPELDARLRRYTRVWVVGYDQDTWHIAPEPGKTVRNEHVADGSWTLVHHETLTMIDLTVYHLPSA